MKSLWIGCTAVGISLALVAGAAAADLSGPVPGRNAGRIATAPGPGCLSQDIGHQYDIDVWHPWRNLWHRRGPDGRNNRFDAETTQFLVAGGVLICGEMPDWPSASGPQQMRTSGPILQ
ncbi:MAG: hypothetical protein WDM84_00240 [Bauldia sp.]